MFLRPSLLSLFSRSSPLPSSLLLSPLSLSPPPPSLLLHSSSLSFFSSSSRLLSTSPFLSSPVLQQRRSEENYSSSSFSEEGEWKRYRGGRERGERKLQKKQKGKKGETKTITEKETKTLNEKKEKKKKAREELEKEKKRRLEALLVMEAEGGVKGEGDVEEAYRQAFRKLGKRVGRDCFESHALKVLKDLRKQGITPNSRIYHAIFQKILNLEAEHTIVQTFLSEMKVDKATTDEETTQILLSIFGQKEKTKLVKSLLKFKEEELQNSPRGKGHALLSVYSSCDMVDEAFEVLKDMRKKGLPPSTETYAPLVRHAIKNPSYHFLVHLSENMLGDGVARPGLLLAFMKLYCMNGDVEACGRICHHLNQRGFPLKEDSVKNIIEASVTANQPITTLLLLIEKLCLYSPLSRGRWLYLLLKQFREREGGGKVGEVWERVKEGGGEGELTEKERSLIREVVEGRGEGGGRGKR